MNTLKKYGASAATLGLLLSAPVAYGQSPASEDNRLADELVVTTDRVGLIEDRPTETVFGLSRSGYETPRSISVISDTTINRYAIEDIDDFITTTPGTFGGSFFGVPGFLRVILEASSGFSTMAYFQRPLGQPTGSRLSEARRPSPMARGVSEAF
jgi:hypothetical protein